MKYFIYSVLIFLFLQVKSQTKEIDSLSSDMKKYLRLYDSCSKKWQQYVVIKNSDSSLRWDYYACMKYWQSKVVIVSDIIDHKRNVWAKQRGYEFYKN